MDLKRTGGPPPAAHHPYDARNTASAPAAVGIPIFNKRIGQTLAAIMPTYWLFGLALVLIGIAAQTLTTTGNSMIQMSTEPAMRGRVVAIFMAIALGGTPIGAPIVGRVADVFGPRWALGIGAAAGFAAAIVGFSYLVKYHNLRVRLTSWRLCFTFDDAEAGIESPQLASK